MLTATILALTVCAECLIALAHAYRTAAPAPHRVRRPGVHL